ncbi:exosortase A [Altererythrobacter sp.]|uniref:exosortase A n=1 Tax=Altererythrobacter sp. TaxID=1872480 RepID=UPI003D084ADC
MLPDRLTLSWPGEGPLTRLPAAWRNALLQLAVAWMGLILLTAREWGEMLHQWWDIDTYNHILLVPIIVAWLVALRKDVLGRLTPTAWWPGIACVALALFLWFAGRVTEINLFAQAGAVAALQGAVLALLGPRVGAALLLPLGYMAFLVPFGDEIIPSLQTITAKIAIALTHLSGVSATIDGIYIDTAAGLFVVAEACSGVKFLIAMVALGALVCFTAFASWTRRAIFLLACVVVPILANGVRAWGTIYIAQSQGVEFAAGFDHIFYGWIFFAVVVVLLLGAAWRYFEREPDEAGLSLEQIESNSLLAILDRNLANPVALLAALAAILAFFMIGAIYAPPFLL